MNKQIQGLHNRLMGLLDESHEIFLRERPYLKGEELEITPLEEATQNQLEIELTAKALTSAVRKTLPEILPPKQQDLL